MYLKAALLALLIFLGTYTTFTSNSLAMKRGSEDARAEQADTAASSGIKRKRILEVRNPLYDTTFKLVFLQPKCLMEFLNSIYNFEGDEKVTEVIYLNQEFPGRMTDAKSVIFDLHCRTVGGETFIVEMQKAFIEGMTNRLELYSATTLRHQWETYTASLDSKSPQSIHRKRYGGLQPVRTLVLMDYKTEIFRKNPGHYIHTYKILHTETGRNDLPLQQWTLIGLCSLRTLLMQSQHV